VNIFAPISSDSRFSWAIEGEKGEKNISFQISEKSDGIILENKHLKIVVNDNFKVDIYDSEGRSICEDYRGERRPFPRRGNFAKIEEEGHLTVDHWGKHKIEVMKVLTGEEYIYGLGEETGHLNK